jgi:hypothetical protein
VDIYEKEGCDGFGSLSATFNLLDFGQIIPFLHSKEQIMILQKDAVKMSHDLCKSHTGIGCDINKWPQGSGINLE